MIRFMFIDRSTWTGNFMRIEDVLKILDQGDAKAYQKPREISNRRVGS